MPGQVTRHRRPIRAACPDKSRAAACTHGRALLAPRPVAVNFSRYTPDTRPAVNWVTPNHSSYYSRETPNFSYIFRVLTRHILKSVQILGVSRRFYVLHNFGCLFLFILYNLPLSVLHPFPRYFFLFARVARSAGRGAFSWRLPW